MVQFANQAEHQRLGLFSSRNIQTTSVCALAHLSRRLPLRSLESVEEYPTGQSQHRLAHGEWHSHDLRARESDVPKTTARHLFLFRERRSLHREPDFFCRWVSAKRNGRHSQSISSWTGGCSLSRAGQSSGGHVGDRIQPSSHGATAHFVNLLRLDHLVERPQLLPETSEQTDEAADPHVRRRGGCRS